MKLKQTISGYLPEVKVKVPPHVVQVKRTLTRAPFVQEPEPTYNPLQVEIDRLRAQLVALEERNQKLEDALANLIVSAVSHVSAKPTEEVKQVAPNALKSLKKKR